VNSSRREAGDSAAQSLIAGITDALRTATIDHSKVFEVMALYRPLLTQSAASDVKPEAANRCRPTFCQRINGTKRKLLRSNGSLSIGFI
jgi:hypothetical protein